MLLQQRTKPHNCAFEADAVTRRRSSGSVRAPCRSTRRYVSDKGEPMTRLVIATAMLLFLAGCVTGEQMGKVREGMSKEEVLSTLGSPDGFQRSGDYEALRYTNRLISGWSWDRTDYTVILKNGQVVEYGPGQVRQRDPNTGVLVLVPLR